MRTSDRKGKEAIFAGSAGMVLGVIVMLIVNDMLWWLGAMVGAVSVTSIWMHHEIAYAVPIAAKVAARNKAGLPAMFYVVTTIVHGIKNMDLFNKWRVVGIVLSSSITLIIIHLMIRFPEPSTEQHGTLYSPYLVIFMLIAMCGMVGIVRGAKEVKHIKMLMLVTTTVGVVPVSFYLLWECRQAIQKEMIGLYESAKLFAYELYRLLYSQDLIRSLATGFLGVAIAHFVLVGRLNFQEGPTLLVSIVIGGALGYALLYVLPEPARKTAEQ